jgi:alkaline phosphatase
MNGCGTVTGAQVIASLNKEGTMKSWTGNAKRLMCTVGLVSLALALMFLPVGPGFTSEAHAKAAYTGTPAKYVFLLIGDGMGIPQRTAAEQYTGKKLLMNTLPAQGITTTHAADRFITGSAASATAMASGLKTNIGVVGLDPALKQVKTLAEMAQEQGKKVGIISSVSIDHATPAAFYAHVPKRGQYYDIDVALAESGFDYFAGGGLKDPTNKRNNSQDFRGDARELAKNNGYRMVTNKEQFLALSKSDGKIIAYNDWLQDSKALPYHMDNRPQDITLAEFTQKGIELLDNDKGFFMMIEGGKIDWACHANDGTASIHDTLAFDAAVQVAYDFYEKHSNETLIVVTGDHECGGLTLGFAGTKYATNFEVLGKQTVSFQKFSDEILGDFKKQGDGATFAKIKPMITRYFGLTFDAEPGDPMGLQSHEQIQLMEAFERTMSGETEKSKDPGTYLLYGEYEPLTVTLTHILNQKAGMAWTSYKHTGVPVSTSAIGVGAETFNGAYDNTDIALKIMPIMGAEARVQYASEEPSEEPIAVAAAN